MGKKIISFQTKQAIIQDWKYGKFKNQRRLGLEYGVSAPSIKRILDEAKVVWGSESEEYEKIKNGHIDATRDYTENPTEENRKRLEAIRDALPRGNSLFGLLDIVDESNGIIAEEILEEIEHRLIRSNLVRINAKVNTALVLDEKEVLLRDGERVYTTLDSQDLKNFTEIADKSLTALGLAQKVDNNITVGVQVQQQNNNAKNSLKDFYSDIEEED